MLNAYSQRAVFASLSAFFIGKKLWTLHYILYLLKSCTQFEYGTHGEEYLVTILSE